MLKRKWLTAVVAIILTSSGAIGAAVATTEDSVQQQATQQAAQPAAIDCGGYAEPRTWVEAQSWWTRAQGADPDTANDFGHVHVGACVPERETVSADTTVKVRIVMHENPGTLLDMSVVYKGVDQEDTVAKVAPPRRTCDGTCEMFVNAPISPAKFDASGLQEMRFRVFVDEPDGKRMHTSLNWQLNIQNGKAREDVSRKAYVRGKGWYTDFGYCEPDILSVPVPDRPVSGIWQPKVQQVDHGSGDVDPTHHRVTLDSDAHAGIPGTILRDGAGPLPATTLSIDTTKLADGPHRLAQRVDCQDGDQVNSGVLVTQFFVANGNPVAPAPTETSPSPSRSATSGSPSPTAPTRSCG